MVNFKNGRSAYLFLILFTFYPVDTKLVYPSVKRNETEVEVHFDKKVPNPYKWLTTASQTEKEHFMEEQNKLTSTYLANISTGDRQSIEKYMKIYEHEAFLHFETTVKAGDKYFFFETRESKVFFQKNQKDKPRIVLSTESKEHANELLIAAIPSTSGDTIAHSFCTSVEPMLLGTYHFRNVATGKDLSDVLYNVSTLMHSGDLIQWSIDGSGIFYLSNTSTPSAANGESSKNQKMYIFYHAIGTKQTEDILLAELPTKSIWGLTLTEDGQYLVAVYDATREAIMTNTWARNVENSNPKEMGSIYYLEPCPKGKAPCTPTKDKKPKMTKIDIVDNQFKFIGSKDNQFYILHSSDGGTLDRIVQLDLSKPTQKDWKTIISVNSFEESISFAGVVKSEFLFVVYLKQLSLTSRMDMHKLSSISDGKKVGIKYGRITGVSIGRKDSKVIFHMASILNSQEAYVVDLAKPLPEKILLPGCNEDPFRDTIVTAEKHYTFQGTQMPIVIMHGKNFKKDGKSPAMMLLEGASLTQLAIHKLLVPFMETFNGVVALARIALPPYQSTPCPPSDVSIQSTEAAIQFLIKEKYTDKSLLTLAPGNIAFSSVLAAVINQQPNSCSAALLIDPAAPSSGELNSDTAKWVVKRSFRKLDLTSYFKDNASTEEYLKVSPLHNIKAPTSKKIQYPAVLLVDIGSDDGKRYISELQHQIGSSSQQVNPLLAKFPAPKSNSRKSIEEAEMEQYADIFSFLVLSVNYKVTK